MIAQLLVPQEIPKYYNISFKIQMGFFRDVHHPDPFQNRKEHFYSVRITLRFSSRGLTYVVWEPTRERWSEAPPAGCEETGLPLGVTESPGFLSPSLNREKMVPLFGTTDNCKNFVRCFFPFFFHPRFPSPLKWKHVIHLWLSLQPLTSPTLSDELQLRAACRRNWFYTPRGKMTAFHSELLGS